MLPTVIIHMGISLDGRYDWSLGGDSPYYKIVRALKADADLSGSHTIMTANLPKNPEKFFGETYDQYVNSPNRGSLVVVDSLGQVTHWDLIKKQPWWRHHVSLCSRKTPHSHLDYLRKEGVDYIIAGNERIDLRTAFAELYTRYQLYVIRVDSGGILNGVLLRAGLVDEVSVVIAPELVGGISPYTLFAASDLTSSDGVIPLRLIHFELMANDYIWMRYVVIKD
jgi:2,5-diamino-6-(ribosylamino)-4(3H)-pyrimidinone 5'-phosphate reductase